MLDGYYYVHRMLGVSVLAKPSTRAAVACPAALKTGGGANLWPVKGLKIDFLRKS